MDSTHYLTPGEIYDLAVEAMRGEEPVPRDGHLIRAAAARPAQRAFGVEPYPTLLEKAAALLHSFAAHHLFFDGNKRIATHITEAFLKRNGRQPTWTPQQAYDFVLEVAQNRHDVPAIALWLAAHSTQQTP